MANVEILKLSDLRKLPGNPRKISADDFDRLKKSIAKFGVIPGRPFLVSNRTGENVIIGGNQRFEACKALGIDEVPVHVMAGLSEAEEREIIIRDNVSNGEWDYRELEREWNIDDLADWGIDTTGMRDEEDDTYTKKIDAPNYEPKNEKPEVARLYDTKKADLFIREIENAMIPEDVAEFLKMAAYRHTVFDYAKIADYYAHAPKEIQELMERSALVIVDYNSAIASGYVVLSESLGALFLEEHGNG